MPLPFPCSLIKRKGSLVFEHLACAFQGELRSGRHRPVLGAVALQRD